MSAKRKPIKFKRMADALLEDLGGGVGGEGSSSSGSDHFPSGSLSDLVNSFLQRAEDNDCGDDVESNDSDDCSSSSSNNNNEERKGLLKKLLGHEVDDDGAAESRRKIVQEIEGAGLQDQIGITSVDSAFKRRLMAHLRQRGYDAGLCKSRWEKSGRYPAGSYEYVDIITSSDHPFTRDIIEIFPARQFEIARPTDGYTALLQGFPPIFIGKPDKLKQVVRLMSAAMKESLKSNALPVAPWRRNGYLQAQWFAPYKRTTNVVSAAESPALQPQGKIRRIVLGFVEEMDSPAAIDCGREFSRKGGKRSGLLAAAFQGKLLESTSSG